MSAQRLSRFTNRLKNSLMALLFVGTQVVFPLAAGGIASAGGSSPTISASTHEGQLNPEGTYSSGDIKTYRAGDSINFHFTLSASDTSSGQLQVDFTDDGGSCQFFTDSFTLGSIDNVSGASPAVTTVGSPTAITSGANKGDWAQVLAVNFSSVGQAVINYTLKLTTEAGDCSGSSQHSRLNNVSDKTASGDFANIGALNVPVPAQDILSLPSITINKTVSSGSAVPSDFTFHVSPAINGQSDYTVTDDSPADGFGSVTIPDISADGTYTITETGPDGYSFSSGSGTNCTFDSSTATATVAAGTAPTNAICNFTNSHNPDSLTIVKQVVNNNGGNNTADSFAVKVNGTQLSGGTLSKDGLTDTYTYGNPQDNTQYTISEDGVSGYTQTSLVCKDDSSGATVANPVVLSAGQGVTCTLTNDDVAPSLTVVKNVSGGTAKANDFTLRVNGTALSGGTLSNSDLTDTYTVSNITANTAYTVSEDAANGYTGGSWSCTDDSTHQTVNDPVTLSEGQSVTCSITNTRDTGTVTVNKAIVPSNDSGKFNLSITGPTTYTATDQSNGGSTGTQTVYTGTYTVSETAGTATSVGNYSSSYECYDGNSKVASGNATTSAQFSVTKDHDIVCTFTNTRYASISGIKYNVDAAAQSGDGTGTTVPNWFIYLLVNGKVKDTTQTLADGSFSFTGLLPDTYTLAECQNASDGCSTWTQIYGPSNIALSAGQDSAGNDFGNFANASISGYKFNDLNGNAGWDTRTEPGLPGWTITLYDGNNFTHKVDQQITGGDGSYSFANLAPGTYEVCETQQTGWTPTYPDSTGCQSVDVTLSGHDYSDTDFGNRGYGTLTVVKNVDDGFGKITKNATDWTWRYDGAYSDNTSLSTGKTNVITVPADTYTVSETPKSDYHFGSVVCKDNNKRISVDQAESTSVSVAAGDDIVCTYTNVRDTATITVNKTVVSDKNDSGRFDLSINGPTDYTKKNQKDGGTTGTQTVMTGTYTVSEAAANNHTDPADYSTVYSCYNDREELVASGDTTTSDAFSAGKDDRISCTFTNTKLAKLTVVKDAHPNSGQKFTFHFGQAQVEDVRGLIAINAGNSDTKFKLVDNGGPKKDHSKQFTQLAPGEYYVSEDKLNGWDLTKITCTDGLKPERIGNKIVFSLNAGDNITCTFRNVKRATVVVTKFNDLDLDGQYQVSPTTDSLGVSEPALPGWDMMLTRQNGRNNSTTQTTGGDGTTTFNNVRPGFYSLDETQQDNWNLSNIYCTDTEGGLDGPYYFTIKPGATVYCYVGNSENPALEIAKSNNASGAVTDGAIITYTITVDVPTDSGTVFGATVTDLPPDNFIYVPGSWTSVLTDTDGSTTDLKENGTTTEPSYGSPGIWNLGNLLPGQKITLTYQTLIGNGVSNGTYKDLAFTTGCSTPLIGGQCWGNTVTGNLNAATPFVGAQVTVTSFATPLTFTAGQVLGTTVLANTGTNLLAAQYILPILLVAGVYITRRFSEEKGGKQ